MINLTEHENGLEFGNVYIYFKSLAKPKHWLFRKITDTDLKGVGYHLFESSENILHPSEVKKNNLHI